MLEVLCNMHSDESLENDTQGTVEQTVWSNNHNIGVQVSKVYQTYKLAENLFVVYLTTI